MPGVEGHISSALRELAHGGPSSGECPERPLGEARASRRALRLASPRLRRSDHFAQGLRPIPHIPSVDCCTSRPPSNRRRCHRRQMPWVYILRCANGALYVGMTGNLERRLERHNEGTACAYTRHRRPVTLAYSEETATTVEATVRERQIKRWTHAKKAALVAGDFRTLHSLSRRRQRIADG